MPSMDIRELTQERNYVGHTVHFILEKSKIVSSANTISLQLAFIESRRNQIGTPVSYKLWLLYPILDG